MKPLHLKMTHAKKLIAEAGLLLVVFFFSYQPYFIASNRASTKPVGQCLFQEQHITINLFTIPTQAEEAHSGAYSYIAHCLLSAQKLNNSSVSANPFTNSLCYATNPCLSDEGRHLVVKYRNLRI